MATEKKVTYHKQGYVGPLSISYPREPSYFGPSYPREPGYVSDRVLDRICDRVLDRICDRDKDRREIWYAAAQPNGITTYTKSKRDHYNW